MTVSTPAAKVFAVVPAAGVGKRMGAAMPKQYLQIAGKSVLEHTVERLARYARIQQVVIAVAPDDEIFTALRASLPDNCVAVTGGAERCHSVLAGLDYLSDSADARDWVLVHDAARPCLRSADIDRMLEELADSEVGGILAVPVRDTLKFCGSGSTVERTVDRRSLWHALTPQMFRLGFLKEAIETALRAGRIVTDEAQAVELQGHAPRVVAGHGDNLKITQAEDLYLAEMIIAAQGRISGE